MKRIHTIFICYGLLLAFAAPLGAAEKELPPNRFVELHKDPVGARRGSALRFVPDAKAFFLWGWMNADYELLQENPAKALEEYDMVAFDPAEGRWRAHLPKQYEALWSKKLPQVYIPRAYSGITSGSERSLFRPPPDYPAEIARPDLNIVFDQVAYHPPTKSLVYFTGGLTAAYDVEKRAWRNLSPAHSPPPVLGGSLTYDPLHDEMVLFGGGSVAEAGPDGRIVGYTGTWAYSFKDKDWRKLPLQQQPPPRVNMRLVSDTKNQVLVLFGGDSHSHYLADTWLFDFKSRQWRLSKAPGPPPRAGHFTAYDPRTGWVIIGGGYNRQNLTDMWAYDAAKDRWQKLVGDVPTGFYLSADLDPERRLILLATSTRRPGDGHNCNVLYPVRTTYACKIDEGSIVQPYMLKPQEAMAKRPVEESGRLDKPDPERMKMQAERLRTMPANQWVALGNPARTATTRTWGSATFDTDRGRILYWGGQHCGYGGSEADAYDIDRHTWISTTDTPEYPHRLWDLGVRLAGVTIGGNPWTIHGRRYYAYDPTSKKMLMARYIQLTTGYVPEPLKDFPGEPRARVDAKVKPPSSYSKNVTWALDPDSGKWDILGPAPEGLDTLVTTAHGVMGVNVDWPSRLNDAGYNLPWSPDQPPEDKAVFHFDSARKTWKRLGEKQACPQNLYEMTALVHDSQRDRVLLHGGGAKRDELWAFDLKTNRWSHRQPKVAAPAGAAPPVCSREAVYLPQQDVMLIYGPHGEKREPALWAYKPADNAWSRIAIDPPKGIDPRLAAGQNRALVYDPKRDLVLLVLGTGGDRGKTMVWALRYRHDQATVVK